MGHQNRYLTHLWPRHISTLGEMRKHKVPVYAHCAKCNTNFKVNIDLLILAHGQWYSLINKKGVCPRYECEGATVFLAQTGAGIPFRTLRERDRL